MILSKPFNQFFFIFRKSINIINSYSSGVIIKNFTKSSRSIRRTGSGCILVLEILFKDLIYNINSKSIIIKINKLKSFDTIRKKIFSLINNNKKDTVFIVNIKKNINNINIKKERNITRRLKKIYKI